MSSTILVRVSGRDRPGITAGLMGVLETGGATLYDVEQVVLRGRLTLGLLIHVPEGRSTIKDLLFFGWENGLQVDFEIVEESSSRPPRHHYAVTVIAQSVTAAAFGAVAAAVAGAEGNIERIARLSRYPVVSYELSVTGGDLDAMRRALAAAAVANRIDVAVQPEGISRRAKRLVVLDVDSTLIQDEVVELLAEEAGVVDEVRAVTAAAMAGELDFEQALRRRVKLLSGLDTAALERVRGRIRLTPGARTFIRTLRRLGYITAIVSGGFAVFTDSLREELDVDHAFGNTLEIVDGVVTGELLGPIVDRAAKADILRQVAEAEGISLEQTVAVGDGANDLDMLAAAGLGIAFNAKPLVRQAADTALTVPFLDAVLFLLGIRREDVEAADAEDPGATAPVPVEGLPPA